MIVKDKGQCWGPSTSYLFVCMRSTKVNKKEKERYLESQGSSECKTTTSVEEGLIHAERMNRREKGGKNKGKTIETIGLHSVVFFIIQPFDVKVLYLRRNSVMLRSNILLENIRDAYFERFI